LVFANLAGFIAGSLLVGLPFTAISFFAMQDVRRLRPHHAARFMGLLTAAYGIGQIVGPPLVSHLLRQSTDPAQGFAWSLTIASTALLIGAVLYLIMWLCWPINIRSNKA
jgi:fucose permease